MKEIFKNKTLKTKKLKLLIYLMLLVTAIITSSTTNVQAAVLQANSATHASPATATGDTCIVQVRLMEQTGGTMGLNAIYDDTSATTYLESVSNNIDVHMMKSTEWGAVEILAASGYGAGSSAQVTKTTTTNPTGVYFDGSTWEWVAGLRINLSCDARYYNQYKYNYYSNDAYQSETSANGGPKAGDGLGSPTLSGTGKYPGCAGWPSSSNTATWFDEYGNAFIRGGSKVFSFRVHTVGGDFLYWNDYAYTCRGVAVVGEGL